MDKPLDPNLETARLARRREALAAQREREEENAVLVIYSEAERGVVPAAPQPKHRIDPRKLRMKKQEKIATSTTKGWDDSGKTARDKKKVKDPSRRTNNPAISQSMKGKAGQKPSKSGK